MPKPIVAGLDIGSSSIRLIVVAPGTAGGPPRLLARVKKESRGLRRGYVVNFDEALESIREAVSEAERQSKLKLRSVFLGLGGLTLESKTGDGQIIVSTADLEISDTDLERALAQAEASLGDFANRHILHAAPVAFKLDGKKILGRPEGLKGNKLEVRTLFVHCLTQHLNDLMRVVAAAGLEVDDVIAAPVAAATVVLSPTQKAAGVVLANIGSQTTSLVTFEEGAMVALAVLPLGSNDVTNDIALGLRLPIEEAEQVKLQPSSAPTLRRKLDEIIEARLADLFELIDTHLKKIGRSGLLPAGIVMVGGGATGPELEDWARSILRLPAKIYQPHEDSRLKNQLPDSGWVVAYGLCLIGLKTGQSDDWGLKLRQLLRRAIAWFKDFWP